VNTVHIDIETLIDYLHRELAPGDDVAVMAHLADCAPCRALYEDEARLSDSLRAYARANEQELPAGVAAIIRATIRHEGTAPSWAQRFSLWMRPAIALPVAAALVFAMYLGIAKPYLGTTAVIDAAYYIDDHAALTSTVPFGQGNVVPATLENDETGADQRWVASTGASDIAATH